MKTFFTISFAVCLSSIILFTSCTKERPPSCDDCPHPSNPPDELTIDYPSTTTPGYFTVVRAHLNGEVTYPAVVKWYDHLSQYIPTLQQSDTLTSGTIDWYTFFFLI